MDSTWQTTMLELENGARQTLRDDGEFGLYRVRCRSTAHGRMQPALLVAPLREHTAPRSLRRLEHEYSFSPARPHPQGHQARQHAREP